MKNGFTLAEVLITLGIIGIVAALTIPGLIGNYKRVQYSARLKKFYSTMQQAILMYNNESGEISGEWEQPDATQDLLEEYWNSHFTPYFQNIININKETSQITGYTPGLVIKFTDGTSLSLTKHGLIDIKYDVNGDKLPNIRGRDQFNFILDKGKLSAYTATDPIGDTKPPEGETDFTTNLNDRNNVLRLCKAQGLYCSQLLFLDGWEFKKDYPQRL